MSRQTKFLIALAIAFLSIVAITVIASTDVSLFFPVMRQGYYIAPTPSPTPLPTPTERPPGVYIDSFTPSEIPAGDYLVIINTTDNKVDFTDWIIKAERALIVEDSKYEFKDGFKLGVDKTVRVRSGIGTDSSTDLYWWLNYSLWWTYPTNCAYLKDDDGELVHKWCVDWEWD